MMALLDCMRNDRAWRRRLSSDQVFHRGAIVANDADQNNLILNTLLNKRFQLW